MAEDVLVGSLEAAWSLHRASRLRKLLTIPGKLARSGLARRRPGRVVKTRVKTFWGGQMTVVLPERVSMTIYRYGMLEYELSRAFVEYLKPGMTFFDVGAHFGYFTCLASHIVGPTGQVHSFEPTRSTFEILKENAATRPNVRVNNVAAFSEPKTIQFNDFGIADSAFNSFAAARMDESQRAKLQPQTYEVKAIRLDDYVSETGARPDAIKIDAESAEYDILLGMERVLSEVKPAISIEVGDYALEGVASSSKVVQYLSGKGYVPHGWRDGALRRHEARSSYGYDNLLFLP
jgi:FkbM family methyltransferase